MSVALSPEDFPAFFEAVYGFEPFKWQTRLVAEVFTRRRWPDLFDLPTASGKTAVIDAAVFLLALDAAEPAPLRWAPRRIVMIVDRRVVVDQAAVRAEQLVKRLELAKGGKLGAVRDRLASLTGGEGEPLSVATLRGGVVRDDAWIRRPDQPLVIASTVDQVGSRLLFQGYGVSRLMRPIHAGLLANDALFVLDEVHLSQPFSETLQTVRDRYQNGSGAELPSRWHVTELSATPRGEQTAGRWVFRLRDDDVDSSQPGRILGRRISASKPARLVSVKVSARDPAAARRQLADACVQQLRTLGNHDHLRALAVVVNRVDTARLVFEGLANYDAQVVLLTGRMRSLERDPVVRALTARVASGAARTDDGRRLVVIATQCIEAGADFDFDGLITECASLDALRQRFGRVDRIGRLAAAGTPSMSVVLGPSASVADGADDPIYGGAVAATWSWLLARAAEETVDFGISALTLPDDAALFTPAEHAPHLLPATLDLWMETPLSRDQAVPEVAPWLHGTARTDTDVQIVWRADLTERLLREAAAGPSLEEQLGTVRDILSFCRPLSAESLAVPLSAVRAWLRGSPDGLVEVADVEGSVAGTAMDARSEMRPVAIWSGDDTVVTTSPRRVWPGCTVVLPSAYGGLRTADFNDVAYAWWDPSSTWPVTDLGDAAHRLHGRQLVARLFPSDTPGAPHRLVDVPVPDARDENQDPRDHLSSWLESEDGMQLLDGFPARGRRTKDFRSETDDERRSWYAIAVLLASRSRVASSASLGAIGGEVDGDPETSSFTGEEGVRLDSHLRGVGAIAGSLAARCGLPRHLVADLELAGELHDVGKGDERFQAWLRDGLPRSDGSPMLAKSPTPAFDRRARQAARIQAGYPQGMRHEVLSLALISGSDSLEDRAFDWELVRHLVVSHHGWGRPFTPITSAELDANPRAVSITAAGVQLCASTNHLLERVDSGVADRFWALSERYGRFRLAWLEGLLRLADHRASENGQAPPEGDR